MWWQVENENGGRLFVDAEGNEWLESRLKLVDEEELEESADA
jgi:hypothetical protein